MQSIPIKCWICGNDASSGEHHIKKSDLKRLYPSTNQDFPIYHRQDGVKKRPIRSIKSKDFMFNALICAECNNTRTQESDKAWERLSKYLDDNWIKIKNSNEIDLFDAFGDSWRDNMVLVQLFFTKIFGCKIMESTDKVNLTSFSKAILSKKEHPDLYISFRDSEVNSKGNYSAISNIVSYEVDGDVIYMHLFYTVGNLTVDIIYSLDIDKIGLPGTLKPSDMKETFVLSKLSYNQGYSDTNNL